MNDHLDSISKIIHHREIIPGSKCISDKGSAVANKQIKYKVPEITDLID